MLFIWLVVPFLAWLPRFPSAPQAPAAVLDTRKSVAKLTVMDKELKVLGTATGFRYGESGVATNYHIIPGADLVVAEFQAGQRYILDRIVAHDQSNDLLVLSSSASDTALKSIPEIALSMTPVEVGAKIFVVSSPRGLAGTLSDGLLSGHRIENGRSLLQITAPISPGSSGGPLLGLDGKVIGVVASGFKDSQQINFAVPAPSLAALVLRDPLPIADLLSGLAPSLDRTAPPDRTMASILNELAECAEKFAHDYLQLKSAAANSTAWKLDSNTLKMLALRDEARGMRDSGAVPRWALRSEFGWPVLERPQIAVFVPALDREIVDSAIAWASRFASENPDSVEAWRLIEALSTRKTSAANRARLEICRLLPDEPIARLVLCLSLRQGFPVDFDYPFPLDFEHPASAGKGLASRRQQLGFLRSTSSNLDFFKKLSQDSSWSNNDAYLYLMGLLYLDAGKNLVLESSLGSRKEGGHADVEWRSANVKIEGFSFPLNISFVHAPEDTLISVRKHQANFLEARKFFARYQEAVSGQARSQPSTGLGPDSAFFMNYLQLAEVEFLLGDIEAAVGSLGLRAAEPERSMFVRVDQYVKYRSFHAPSELSEMLKSAVRHFEPLADMACAMRGEEWRERRSDVRIRMENNWQRIEAALTDAERQSPALGQARSEYERQLGRFAELK